MKNFLDKINQMDRYYIIRGSFIILFVSIIVFWMLCRMTDNRVVEQCQDRLMDEASIIGLGIDNLIDADIKTLDTAATLFSQYSSIKDEVDEDLIRKVLDTTSFADLFIMYSNGEIVGSTENANLYRTKLADIFGHYAGATYVYNENIDSCEILVYVPIFVGKTSLVGVVDNRYYASAFDLKQSSFANRAVLVDSAGGDIIISFNTDGVTENRLYNSIFEEMEQWNLVSNISIDSIKNNFTKKISGNIVYNTDGSEVKYVSYAPVTGMPWSVMLLMKEDKVEDIMKEFTSQLLGIAILLVVIYFIILLSTVVFLRRKVKENEAIMLQYKIAEIANEAKTNFMSNMSHDIRTPLNAIVGLADICEMNADNPDRVRDCIEKQKAASEHLMTLINDVLDMSRIESGKITLGNSEFGLNEQIHDIVIMLQKRMEEKNLEFKVTVGNLYNENVIGDVQRINRVLLNVLSNSIKYTNAGGKVIVTIDEQPSEKEGYSNYSYTITDTGIGMSQEFIKRIFIPFERMQDSTVSQIEGAGLGMTIANDIVAMMDGSIDVKSSIGQGTTVVITIPLKHADEQPDEGEVEKGCRGKTIVVVDDDPSLVEWIYRLALSLNMHCIATTSASEALDNVKEALEGKEEIVLMIFGLAMAKMDGLTLSREMRKIVGNDIPIVLQTAKEVSNSENEIRTAGINTILVEPIFKKDLIELFRDIASGGTDRKMQFPDFSGKRILLVEDHRINAEIVSEYLEYTGIAVEVVYDGTEAVERMSNVEDGYYDLILMDIRMPKMNGYDATRQIRAMRSNYTSTVPIIALSANAFVEDRRMSREVGMNGHLAKPVKYDEIYEELSKWFK